MEEFLVSIDKFDGPLDLMLHLIKEEKLDLFDLDISLLCDDYLKYIDKMKDMHLEIISDYLIELATLIEYKSKKLFPKDKSQIDDEFEEDSRDRLIKRLLEYQRYKEVSSEFNDLYENRSMKFAKFSDDEEKYMESSIILDKQDPYLLYKAFNRVLNRFRIQSPIDVKLEHNEVSIEDTKLKILSNLNYLKPNFNFLDLVNNDSRMLIPTFLAVLDLVKDHLLYFTVENDDTIWLSRGDKVA